MVDYLITALHPEICLVLPRKARVGQVLCGCTAPHSNREASFACASIHRELMVGFLYASNDVGWNLSFSHDLPDRSSTALRRRDAARVHSRENRIDPPS